MHVLTLRTTFQHTYIYVYYLTFRNNGSLNTLAAIATVVKYQPMFTAVVFHIFIDHVVKLKRLFIIVQKMVEAHVMTFS